MNKLNVITRIIQTLKVELETSVERAKESFDAATDDESRGDGKYDTRGLEASYLAGGQAQQAKELADALDRFEQLKTTSYIEAPSKSICLGSLFEISTENGKVKTWYFLANDRGGVEIEEGGVLITVLTLHSPLGASFIGASVGAKVSMNTGLSADITTVL